MKKYISTFNFSYRPAQIILFALPMVLLISACKKPEPPGECKEDFVKKIEPIKIKNGHDLYFDIDDFDFIQDTSLKIEDIELTGTVKEHHHSFEDFAVSVNGIKAVRRDGGKCFKVDKILGNSQARFSSPAYKFYLNGGDPFHFFIAKVKKQKGELRVSLHGKHNKVVDAELIISGTKYKKCDVPPPPPPPPPVAPKTTIVSKNPSNSPTDVSSMTIEFNADQAGVSFTCTLDSISSACNSPVTYSSLSSGSHTFSVSAKNSAGLTTVQPATYSWVVDTIAPTVTIDNLASLKSITNSTSLVVLFSSNEPGTFNCSIDGGAVTPCSSPATFNGFNEGSHQISINVVDSAGNASSNPAIFQWTVDLTLPVASITTVNPSSAINSSSTISFEFTANESSSFECSVDNNAFASCISPFSISNLVEGPHWFAVRAIDIAENTGIPASYNWRSDYTAPTISFENVLPAAGVTNSDRVFVGFTVSETSDTTCIFDGVPSNCQSPFVASVVTEGEHTLVLKAVDAAGNQSQNYSFTWYMDFTLPTVTFGLILPSASNYINSTTLTAEIIPSERVDFIARLNSVDLGQSNTPITLTNLVEGAYTLEVMGLDSAGNPSNTISHSFNVDLTVPVITLASEITGLTNLDNNILTMSSSEPVTYMCNIDGAGFGICNTPLALSGLAQGDHLVSVYGVDVAGNQSEVLNAAWTVDTIAPTTVLTAQVISRDTVNFSFSTGETSTFMCAIDSGALNACASPLSVTFSGTGDHTFTVKATDVAGNTEQVGVTYNFTVRPPVTTTLVSIVPGGPAINTRDITFTFSSNHNDATFICSLDGAPASTCNSPVSYTALADGNHSFVVKAVDIWGGVDPVGASHSWAIDATAPVVSGQTQSATTTTITVNWTTNEPATSQLNWGTAGNTNNVVPDDGVYKTSHSVRITGLTPNTLYTVRPSGHDLATNNYVGNQANIRTGR